MVVEPLHHPAPEKLILQEVSHPQIVLQEDGVTPEASTSREHTSLVSQGGRDSMDNHHLKDIPLEEGET